MNEKKSALRELYRRLRADHDRYTKWLLRQPEKEILSHAPDYLVRKAIVDASKRYTKLNNTSRHYLFADQIDVQLRSKTPIEDI